LTGGRSGKFAIPSTTVETAPDIDISLDISISAVRDKSVEEPLLRRAWKLLLCACVFLRFWDSSCPDPALRCRKPFFWVELLEKDRLLDREGWD
jgi:hypothetical protein